MKIIIQRLFFIFSIILGSFLYDNSAIQAKKGDPATLNMTVYVYSYIKDILSIVPLNNTSFSNIFFTQK